MNSGNTVKTNPGGRIPGTRRSGSSDPKASAPMAESSKGPQERLTASPPVPKNVIVPIDVDSLESSGGGPLVCSIKYLNRPKSKRKLRKYQKKRY